MKHLTLALLCLTVSHLSFANPTLNHRDRLRVTEAYKASSELNHFIFLIDMACNHGRYADWRIKQNDEAYKSCVNEKYKSIVKKFPSLTISNKEQNLYIQNIKLEGVIKEAALKKFGVPLFQTSYGIKDIDYSKPEANRDSIGRAAEYLSNLTES